MVKNWLILGIRKNRTNARFFRIPNSYGVELARESVKSAFIFSKMSQHFWRALTSISLLCSTCRWYVKSFATSTNERRIEHNKDIEVRALQKCWDIFKNIKADFTLSLASSTPRAFAIPPGSYKPKTSANVEKNHVERDSHNSDRNQKRPIVSDKQRGWLIADGNFNFPRTLSVTPCKKISCEDKECTYGRRCSFFHGRSLRTTKNQIAHWLRTGSRRQETSNTLVKSTSAD